MRVCRPCVCASSVVLLSIEFVKLVYVCLVGDLLAGRKTQPTNNNHNNNSWTESCRCHLRCGTGPVDSGGIGLGHHLDMCNYCRCLESLVVDDLRHCWPPIT